MDTASLQDFGPTLDALRARIEREVRADGPDLDALRRSFEEIVATTTLDLDRLDAQAAEVVRGLGAEPLRLAELESLNRFLESLLDAHERVGALAARFAARGLEPGGCGEFLARFGRVAGVVRPLAERLRTARFRLPSEPGGVSGPAEAGSGGAGRATESGRRPGPYFEPDEASAPFDLPRPGLWEKVTARPGLIRLPDPIDG
jgi:hypothetical protein